MEQCRDLQGVPTGLARHVGLGQGPQLDQQLRLELGRQGLGSPGIPGTGQSPLLGCLVVAAVGPLNRGRGQAPDSHKKTCRSVATTCAGALGARQLPPPQPPRSHHEFQTPARLPRPSLRRLAGPRSRRSGHLALPDALDRRRRRARVPKRPGAHRASAHDCARGLAALRREPPRRHRGRVWSASLSAR